MAVKKPVVIGSNGLLQQLQAADSISVASAAISTYSATNSEVGAIVCGTPVYSFSAGTVKKGQANAAGTAKVLGLMLDASTAAAAIGVVAMDGLLTLTTAQWDAVTGGSGGLVFNTDYFLDPATSGKITSTPPTTVGQLLVYIGTAMSTVDLMLDIDSPVLL